MKYRPSVERAALVADTTAVPAEPVKPEMKAAKGDKAWVSYGCGAASWPRSQGPAAHLDVRRTEQCIRIGDYLRRGRLEAEDNNQA